MVLSDFRANRRVLVVRFLAAASLLLLVACGGGSSGVPSAPVPAPSTQSWKNTATLTMAFTSTHTAARRPAYVSPSSQSVRVTVNSVDGGTPPSWVTPNPSVVNFATTGSSSNCTISGGTETCTITVPAPPGKVSYTFELFDASNATGNKVGTVTQSFSITQGQTTPLDVTMSPVVSSVSVSAATLTPSNAIPGAMSSEQLTFTVKDADGNVISGSDPFASNVSFSISDTFGATSLSTGASPTCPGSASVSVTFAQQPVWVCYSGEATSNAVVSSNVSGGGTIAAGETLITFTGTALCSVSTGCAISSPNYNAPTVFFTTLGTAATLSANEAGWSQAPYNQQFDLTLDPATCDAAPAPSIRTAIAAPTAIVATSANPATSWSITPLRAGLCKGSITEHAANPPNAHGAVVWFSVTTASLSGY